MPEAKVSIEGLREFLQALRRYEPEVRKGFNKNARGVVASIAADAKSRASWSRRIPGAIGSTVTTLGAGVRLSKRAAPHGPLYERGQRGSGQFRHPLFGNRAFWYVDQTRPFLEPAVESNKPQAIEAMMQAINEAKRKAGLA